MRHHINEKEFQLLAGTQEIVIMLRNKIMVPTEVREDVINFLEVNASDLWHFVDHTFYFLGGVDLGNVVQIIANFNQKKS